MDIAQLIQEQLGLVVGGAAGVMVIGGALFAVMRSGQGAKNAALWCAGAYGLWSGAEDSATWTQERAVQSLKSWYGVENRQGLKSLIDSLQNGQTGNPAWDMVRAIDLLRMGVAATYLDNDDCYERAAGLAKALQAAYGSWEELGQAFEAGMQAWQRSSGISSPKELGRVQANLPLLRSSVWPKVRWTASWGE